MAPATPAAPVRRPLGLLAGVAVASAVLTLAVATAVPRTPPRPHTPPVTLASPAVAAAPAVARPAVVVYTVQRGDSPWRIAAALTGDGRRWRELDVSGHLRPGQRVTMRLDR